MLIYLIEYYDMGNDITSIVCAFLSESLAKEYCDSCNAIAKYKTYAIIVTELKESV